MGSRILLADDDAWLARTVSQVLTRKGYDVEIADNGSEALDRALHRPPDLLITDAMMPIVDGWTLVRQLRSHPLFVTMPIIFISALSSDEDRIKSFHLGADDYISKPFRFEELDLRVTSSLRRAQRLRDRPTFDGTLTEMGVATLLGLVERERKSGSLRLQHDDGGRAEILARTGQVIQATLLDEMDVHGVACVRRLLRWRRGIFRFTAGDTDRPDRLHMSTTQLLLESARMEDEVSR